MPSWDEVQAEIHSANPHDVQRRKRLKDISEVTGRNVIAYYSAFLEKENLQQVGITGFEVTDTDKNGFMATIHKLDRSKGLDLILHTPGGDVAATESLVYYLRQMFGTDYRVIVPHMAMSAGTMIALSSDRILMGKHSCLGPIDPQFGGIAAYAIKEEFEQAAREIASDPNKIALWQPIIAKYPPAFVGECLKAIQWSSQIVKSWLETGMFREHQDPSSDAQRVVDDLGDHDAHKSHSRHIHIDKARELGINVGALEDEQELQEAVLTAHHAFVITMAETPAVKIIENQLSSSYITSARLLPGPSQPNLGQP